MSRLTYRNLNWLLAAAALLGMGFALLFLQRYMGFAPCSLCVFQRVGLIVMGVFALMAAVIDPKVMWARLLLWVGSLAGILWSVGVAARHIWLQHLPADQVPSCGPGLDYWLDTLPLQQVLHEVLSGSGECALVEWRFLGLSIPEQALIFFLILLVLHGVLFWRIFKSR